MRVALLLLAGVVVAAAAPPALAQRGGCPLSACALASFPALAPTVLAGGEQGAELLAGATGLAPGELRLAPLAAELSAEQQALLGCGPYWGTQCTRDGIDLRNADAGVLMQSWVLPGTVSFPGSRDVRFPPARGPFLPDGTPLPPTVQGPLRPPAQFPNEMAALSWNFLLVLVAFSSGDPGDPGAFDPSNPYAYHDPNDPSSADAAGRCSFLQPQYCSSVQALFDIAGAPAQDPWAAGNTRFARRDLTSSKRVRGCLASARGLAGLSSNDSRGWSGNGGRRAGRCPAR